MSLWDEALEDVEPSFRDAVPDPGVDPGSGPLVVVKFNREWKELVCGCILQVCQPPTWLDQSMPALGTSLIRATELLNLFLDAQPDIVTQAGTAAITVLAGAASGGAAVVFAVPFDVPPTVVVSSDSGSLHAWFSDVTAAGFTANLDADVTVIADTAGLVAWTAVG